MSELEWYQKNFSTNLRYQLDKNGLKQQNLVDDLGLSAASVSYWCSGSRIPRMDKIQILADYFGITVSDLLEDKRDEMQDELFEKKQILFSLSEKATAEDLEKIIQIANMIIDG